MTHENDPNPFGTDPTIVRNDRDTRTPEQDSSFISWGIPLVIAAVVLVAGLLFFNASGDRTTTASNEPAVTRQTNPSTPAAPSAPPPAKTQ